MASDECKFVKPIIKWVGGKSQIIDKIISTFPKEIINYKEIFIGGGSVLLALLSSDIKITGKIYAYDLNKILINLYKNIQNNPNELYEKVIMFKKIYSNITENIINKNPNNIKEALKSKESYYYWIRKLFNKEKDNTLIKSAMFIFLNKLCFRGMYREGPNGFNVPFGHYKKIPEIINLEHLNKVSKLIKNVEFINMDFKKSLLNITDNDFVYLDPPYYPLNNKSFVSYTKNGFNLKTHNKLFELIKKINNFVLSNSNTQFILDKFPETKYSITKINCRRAINCKNPASTVKEVIIKPIKI